MSNGSSVHRVAELLREEVRCYSPGAKLPPSRDLISRYQVSPATMSRAIAVLTEDGLVTVRPGAGVFRSATARARVDAGDMSWQEVALGAGNDGGPRAIDATAVLAA